MSTGKFITFEGGEGTGKSTQARLLAQRLKEAGIDCVLTREPGGSATAEKIRAFLLSGGAEPLGPKAEAVLFNVARDDHLEQVIRPALKSGKWVVCDRFADSTRAYQGAAGGVSPALLETLDRIIVGDTRPDLTFIMDLPAREGLRRAAGREAAGKDAGERDYFESKDLDFHEALRQQFLEIARGEPERCVVIDAQLPPSAIEEEVWEAVVERLGLEPKP
ncbi:MAG: dTMP kinase [Methyloligellaceae bacterium]